MAEKEREGKVPRVHLYPLEDALNSLYLAKRLLKLLLPLRQQLLLSTHEGMMKLIGEIEEKKSREEAAARDEEAVITNRGLRKAAERCEIVAGPIAEESKTEGKNE